MPKLTLEEERNHRIATDIADRLHAFLTPMVEECGDPALVMSALGIHVIDCIRVALRKRVYTRDEVQGYLDALANAAFDPNLGHPVVYSPRKGSA
jgi:hypothetical protein